MSLIKKEKPIINKSDFLSYADLPYDNKALHFSILKENWNYYKINKDLILAVKCIVTKIIKSPVRSDDGLPVLTYLTQHISKALTMEEYRKETDNRMV